MKFTKRTIKIENLTPCLAGQTITLNGWVHRIRDYGSFMFINLRDRGGLVQCVIADSASDDLKNLAKELKSEYCLSITGLVAKRNTEAINKDMKTGEIEITVQSIEILNKSLVPPFVIEEGESSAKEDLRLRYRYLDLRSTAMQDRIKLRHKVAFACRDFFNSEDFYEIETPIFMKSTPEGARDYVVPSRIYPGKFFALPQSPQLYKQILMASGMERYFQIARCFRDEDPRGDRQPEFTQIDVEMSFVERDDVLAMGESMMRHIFKKTMNIDLPKPFNRMTHQEAIDRFGSDKPDTRFAMNLFDLNDIIVKTDFEILKSALTEKTGVVKGMIVKNYAETMSRKKHADLEILAKQHGVKGLAWLKLTEAGLEGSAGKFFTGQLDDLKKLGLQLGDVLLISAGTRLKACNALGAIRVLLGKELNLYNPTEFAFVWIIDFPMFEFNEDKNTWEAAHHMFTMPQEKFIDTMEANPGEVLGDLYDLVLNGYELASGSVRVHDPVLQQRIFDLVGYPKEQAVERFGFLLEAFDYGCPPHGGMAFGLDRLVMIMSNTSSIREVIAFPKNTQGIAVLENAPAVLDDNQMKELRITINTEE